MKMYIEISDEKLDDFSDQIADSLLVQTRSKVRKQLQSDVQIWIDELKGKLREDIITDQFWMSLRAKCREQLHAVLSQEAVAFCSNYRNTKQFKELFDSIVQVRHGHWINHPDDLFPADSMIECSVCHEYEYATANDNFCGNCGAKMDEVE